MLIKRNWLLAVLSLLCGGVAAQSNTNETLGKEREAIREEVASIEKNVNSKRAVSREEMIHLNTLGRKVEGQERYIIGISKQPNHLSAEEMMNTTRDIATLKTTIETLKSYYYDPTKIPKPVVQQPDKPREEETYAPPVQRTYPPLPPQHHVTFPVSNASLSGEFGSFKGQIPFPLEKGTITHRFGRYKIENSGPEIVGDNPGFTFSAPLNTPVKAVFEGEVVTVSRLGVNSYVLIRHGRYVTAYSNLASVAVTRGQKVTAHDTIGFVGIDEDNGYGKLDFILMLDNKNLDPQGWFVQ